MASIWDELERKARGAATLVKAASAAGDAAFEKERRKYAEAAWRLEHPGQEPPKGPALQAPRESPMRRWLRKGATAAADALTTPGSASNQQFAEGFETIGELLAPSDPESGLPNIDFGSKAVVPLAVKLNRRRAIQKTAEALAPGAVIERAASTPKGKEHVKFLKDVHFEDLTFPKYETPGMAAPIDRKVSSRDSYFHATRFSTVPDIVASGQIGQLGRFGKKPKKTEKTLDYFSATDAQKVWEKLGEPNMTFIPSTHSHSYQKFVDTAKELGYVVKKDYPADAHYNFWKPAGVKSTTAGVSLGRVNKIKSTIPRDVVFELDRGAMKRAGVPTRPYVESGFEKMKKSYDPTYSDYDTTYDINQNPKGFMEELKQKLIDKGHIGPGGSTDPDVAPSQIYLNKFKDFFEGDIAEFNYHENAQAFKKMIQKDPSIGWPFDIKSTGSAEDGYTLYLKVPPKKKAKSPPSYPSAGFEYEERTFEQGIPLKGTVRRAFVNLDEIKNRGFSEEELRRNIEPLFSLTDDVRGYRTPGHGSTELHRILPSHVLSEGSRYALPRAKNFDDFKDILSGTLSTFKQSKDLATGRKILEKSKPVGVPKSQKAMETPNFDSPLLVDFMSTQKEGDPPQAVKQKILKASGMNAGQFANMSEDMTIAEWHEFVKEVKTNPKVKEYFPDVYHLVDSEAASSNISSMGDIADMHEPTSIGEVLPGFEYDVATNTLKDHNTGNEFNTAFIDFFGGKPQLKKTLMDEFLYSDSEASELTKIFKSIWKGKGK